MKYVLSMIEPPVAPAAFGKATVSPPSRARLGVAGFAASSLLRAGMREDKVHRFVNDLWGKPLGTLVTDEGTGLSFRLDPVDQAPHPCPCGEDDDNPCRRLVLPTDHAYAHAEDAYCLGCWADSVNPGCLPANTGHTEAP